MRDSRCAVCGGRSLETRRETRRYGHDLNVALLNIEVRHCRSCGEEFEVIPRIEELHKLIAKDLAVERRRLLPGEIRFLRTFLGYSSADFASAIGVSPATVSRWESRRRPQPMGDTAERLLRLMVLHGSPVTSYGFEGIEADRRLSGEPTRFQTTQQGWKVAV